MSEDNATPQTMDKKAEAQRIERMGSVVFTFFFWGILAAIAGFVAGSETFRMDLGGAASVAGIAGVGTGIVATFIPLCRRIAGIVASLLDVSSWFQ